MQQEESLYKTIFQKYNKVLLSKKETAEVLGVSTSTLDRLKNQGIGVSYKKLPSRNKNGKGSKVLYPLNEIVEYLTNQNIETL